MGLEDKILQEIDKTGYPTEIVSASAMQNRGWAVVHSPSYLDDLENRSREFDIRAYRTKRQVIRGHNYSVGIYLMTECKKSEKPWVFFTTSERYLEEPIGQVIHWSLAKRQAFTDRENSHAFISDNVLRGFHHYFKQQRLARAFYQAFKGNEKSDNSPMIYSAVMSAIKATLFLAREPSHETWLRIFYPVVIFSGDLFEAEVSPQKKMKLSRANHIQLSFSYSRPQVAQGDFIEAFFTVDVVHEDYLVDFLTMIETEQELIAQYAFDAFERTEPSIY